MSSTSGAGRLKSNLDTDLTPFTTTDLKWVIGLNVKHETIQLPEDDRGETLMTVGVGRPFKIQRRDP